jgi:hypothetical protein
LSRACISSSSAQASSSGVIASKSAGEGTIWSRRRGKSFGPQFTGPVDLAAIAKFGRRSRSPRKVPSSRRCDLSKYRVQDKDTSAAPAALAPTSPLHSAIHHQVQSSSPSAIEQAGRIGRAAQHIAARGADCCHKITLDHLAESPWSEESQHHARLAGQHERPCQTRASRSFDAPVVRTKDARNAAPSL